MTHKANNSNNVYQMVTDRIINQLEQGIIPWQKPWTGVSLADGGAISYTSRKPYSLLNQMLLGREGEYLTWKQIQDLGGKVKKGAESQMVVFFKMMVVEDKKPATPTSTEDKPTEKKQKLIPLLRYYRVFHIDDTIGIESKIKAGEPLPDNKLKPIEQAEELITGYLARESHLKFQNDKPSGKAFYSPLADKVVVPMMSQFPMIEEYYSTTFHELTHSTSKDSRCNRPEGCNNIHFGSKDYSREELVAELGAAMLCNLSGIDCEKAFTNSVAYIQSWLRALKNDNKMIVWAASRAEKASRYIKGEPVEN